jgi:D-glycero-alpha-D-manno-heptose-7-phosphate kinase
LTTFETTSCRASVELKDGLPLIVTRTPFRITLGGGGTDLPSYYRRHGGFVLAMGINKYMYVMLNPPGIDDFIRLHYTQSETVTHVADLKHELAREALRYHGIERKMEVASMADLPAGTGLGSSSAYLVGLLSALHHYRRDLVSLQSIAEEACHIELDVLGKGIGKQDQYMAAFGGITTLTIARNGSVTVDSLRLSEGAVAELVANTHLYYTGASRDAVDMLSAQNLALQSDADPIHGAVRGNMDRIKELGHKAAEDIAAENFDAWGLTLDEHWRLKRDLSTQISIDAVDRIYEEVRANYGVLGGKIVGAGGGGFLLLYCPSAHKRIEQFMSQSGMPRLHYSMEPEGSKVVASLTSGPGITASSRHTVIPAGPLLP